MQYNKKQYNTIQYYFSDVETSFHCFHLEPSQLFALKIISVVFMYFIFIGPRRVVAKIWK